MDEIRSGTVVDASLRETKDHGTKGFPFAAYLDDFAYFQSGYICWHWHREVQITMILEGEFLCRVGHEKIKMGPGDILFINSCALHEISPCKIDFGKLYSFLWKAEMIAENKESDVYAHCIRPILEDRQKICLFQKNHASYPRMKTDLLRILRLMDEQAPFYQLAVLGLMSEVWLEICNYDNAAKPSSPTGVVAARDDKRVKEAIGYMQAHYCENISLDDIAKAALISRSELCKSFQRSLGTTPKDFLMKYRIQQSMVLLANQNLRIADIAEMTGFSSPSHYGGCFLKQVGCTPFQFRKNQISLS